MASNTMVFFDLSSLEWMLPGSYAILAVLLLSHASSLLRILQTLASRWRLKQKVQHQSEQDSSTDISVSGLYIYPVKSLKAVSLNDVVVDTKGLKDDRRYMLVTPNLIRSSNNNNNLSTATHRFLTQRQCPSLTRVKVEFTTLSTSHNNSHRQLSFSTDLSISKHKLKIDAVPKNSLAAIYKAVLWDDIVTVQDMGDEASEFFTNVVKQDADFMAAFVDVNDDDMNNSGSNVNVRLVRQYDGNMSSIGQENSQNTNNSSRYMQYLPRHVNDKYTPAAARPGWGFAAPLVSLADGFSILLANESSLNDLNERLQRQEKPAISMSRFRPNIVIKGAPAYDEDYWKTISIDGVLFHVVKGCPRCKQSCTDQETSKVSEEPLLILAEYRAMLSQNKNNVYFAQNVLPDPSSIGKTISVGAKVVVIERGEPEWGE